MRVHHLNATTMCPIGARFVNGRGGLLERGCLVCHVLLIETQDGLVLVDTGLGTRDLANPQRLGRAFLLAASPRLDPAETAIAQITALGFSATDVRHIVLTHLDLDHAGGMSDFPQAKVHVHAREHAAAMSYKSARPKGRYIPAQWSHSPHWQLYGTDGEPWFGFRGVRALSDSETEILLIPLHGHTLGHCGVAVRAGGGWLLHAGDSYFFHGQIETPAAPCPAGLTLFQRLVDTDREQRQKNQELLRKTGTAHCDEITVFCSHDPVEYARFYSHTCPPLPARFHVL